MMYEDVVKELRNLLRAYKATDNGNCHQAKILAKAADAIEKLLKVASAMHTWIFLHTGDEQAAYDECGLTDEMNAELGYGGQFVIEPQKEET